ncbi:hypothetical protein PMZ80_006928 [Knufia obscura]|uniref:Serine hydrolase domain-containing protein n=2 Tax=Knufia TaxID=430999 RepID=A0AAN8I6Z0_9EURO|nr:hypothetical protein PMZ80_006928 [Knufia obscura]KAK5957467.1 hypothetical protein OHC33_001842 [Knufia fluminis]
MPRHVEDAQEYLLDIVQDEGSFDGVMGFSQITALAASLILEQQKATRLEELFKFAVFICAILPFDGDDSSELQSWEQAKSGISLSLGNSRGSSTRRSQLGPPEELNEEILGRYHPERRQKQK